jgi:Family of unknown function (DUF5681)
MAKATKRAPADYAVGRGKPPAHSRFRPGQSGNPGGRKKGSRNLKSVLEEVMREEIELTENGKKRSVSLLEALIKRAVQEGLRGDLRAIKDLLDRYERHVGPEPEVEEELPAHEGLISVGGNLYSVPDTTRRRILDVQVLADELQIFENGTLIAVHPALEGRDQRRIDPAHRRAAPLPCRTAREPIALHRAGEVVARRSLDFYEAVARRLASQGGAP